jgi:SAM-dependent methyltransferase
MDRRTWLAERRAAVMADYDADAATFDDEPYPAAMQAAFVHRLLGTCPPDGVVLDAPCGTGRYFPLVTSAGRRVVGIDQSAGMLEQARSKGLAEALHHVGLQELSFEAAFDATMTIDAMENVPPEDWPLVLSNLRRATRDGGHLYMSVEEQSELDVDAMLASLVARGLPAVRGEIIEGDVAGYHYYPSREQVADWLAAAGLEVVDEATEPQGGWAYWHLLLRTR